MNQRQHNRTLYWEDEEQDSSRGASAAVNGQHFWRSIWKGIENSTSSRPSPAREARRLPPEPPRDYVVDTEQRL